MYINRQKISRFGSPLSCNYLVATCTLLAVVRRIVVITLEITIIVAATLLLISLEVVVALVVR